MNVGFRFRRRITIGPGLRLNLSKSGVSASVGRRGLWFTAGPRGTRETVGIPGSGLSYTQTQSIHAPDDVGGQVQPPDAPAAPASGGSRGLAGFAIAVMVLVAIAAIAIWLL